MIFRTKKRALSRVLDCLSFQLLFNTYFKNFSREKYTTNDDDDDVYEKKLNKTSTQLTDMYAISAKKSNSTVDDRISLFHDLRIEILM